jgi:hypothetical protein
VANDLYASAKEKFMTGSINMSSDDIRVILADAADYTLSLSTHDFLDDVPSGARVATSAALSSKTVTGGVFDAADVTLSTVTGDQSEYLILYKHTGTESTSPLILLIDTATGLPVTPSGGDITIAWSNGSSRIFAL